MPRRERFNGSYDAAAFAVSADGGATFTTKLIAKISDIPSPLPGATFRDDSFPALALDGSTLHVAWSNWNGADAESSGWKLTSPYPEPKIVMR